MYRWFPRYFPLWLPPSPSDLREWDVVLDPANTTIPVPIANGVIQVSLHRILIEAGIALTQALSASDPRSWFALHRYGGDFAGTAPALRFYNGAKDKDPQLTAVASEEIATGISCYLLRENFCVDHITDAFAAINSGDLAFVNPQSKQRPDYFCLDSRGEVVIAESKGATGTRSCLTPRIDAEGWNQVANVRPVNHALRGSCSRVVIGTHICIDGCHNRSETTTIIKDPEGEDGENRNPNSDIPIRQAYAKICRFIGQETLAERLLLNLPIREIPKDLYQEFNGVPYVLLGWSPFGDIIGIYKYLAEALFRQNGYSLTEKLPGILFKYREERHSLKNIGYGLPNGIAIFHANRF